MRHVVLLACLLAGTSLLAQEPGVSPSRDPATTQPLFRSHSSELVVLPVTVTDGRGRLVTDLPRDRFAVYDQGRRQAIAAFTSEDIPVSIALVVDDSGSMNQKIGQVIAATLSFAKWSHPEDELTVVEFNEHVRDALDGQTVTAADLPRLEAALHTLKPDGETALYDAVMDGIDHLDRASRARRVLVLVSDGGDNASQATLEQVLDRARRSNVTIYAIGLFDENSRDSNPGVLKRLADATGGQRFLPKSPGPLMAACLQIADEIRNSYTIGYEPPDRDGEFHRLRVEVSAPDVHGVKVRTRPGYVAADGTAP